MKTHTKIKIGIVVMIFVASALLSVYSPRGITGYAVLSGSPTPQGTYSIFPSFKTTINYDFSDYDFLKKMTGNLVDACSSGITETSDCIKNFVKTQDKSFKYFFRYNGQLITNEPADLWNTDCETPEESLSRDFTELYTNCVTSGDDGCVCQMNLSDSEKQIRDTINVSSDSQNGVDGVTILLADISNFIPSAIPFHGNTEAQLSQESYNIDFSGRDTITLYKKGSQVAYVKNPTTVAKCSLPNKFVKACIVSSRQELYANPITGATQIQPVVYRYAFELKELPPPPLNYVAVSDERRADKSLVLSWNKSAAPDVTSYAVYLSTDDFSAKATKDISDIKRTVSLQNVAVLDDIDLSQTPVFAGTYKYDATINSQQASIDLNPYTLYYVSSKGIYFYLLPVSADEQQYNLAVTAINKNGDEMDNSAAGYKFTPGVNYVSGKSIDDVPLAKITSVAQSIDPSTKSILLEWDKPVKNIDGSVFDGKAAVSYDVYGAPSGGAYTKISTASTEYVYLDPTTYAGYTFKIVPLKTTSAGEVIPADPSAERTYLLQ